VTEIRAEDLITALDEASLSWADPRPDLAARLHHDQDRPPAGHLRGRGGAWLSARPRLRPHPGAPRADRAQPGRHGHQPAWHGGPGCCGWPISHQHAEYLPPGLRISHRDHAAGTCS